MKILSKATKYSVKVKNVCDKIEPVMNVIDKVWDVIDITYLVLKTIDTPKELNIADLNVFVNIVVKYFGKHFNDERLKKSGWKKQN